ncbi:MAG TPA: ABC transporter permease [Ktedonobacteraceae bacterium]|nr:ABC transporter permease [Ktedonobacteraceae bacterium]
MAQILIKRFIGLVFIVLAISFITFIVGYLAPGDPIKETMGDHFDPRLWQQLRHTYGFDLPWYQQYLNFLGRLARFDLGTSFHPQQRAVWDILKDGVPISAELALWGTLTTLLLAIPIGIWSAIKSNTWIDTTNMSVALILYALPSFVLAIFVQLVLLWINQAGMSWPVTGWGTPWEYTWSDIQYKLVPVLVYAATGYAYYARLARTTMLEVLRQDYIRTARAKGLLEFFVVYRHALRNAIIPLITVFGVLLGFLVTGSFLIETIFNIHGIANITVNAVFQRNYPVIQATTILVAITVVLGNLVADLLYSFADPRITFE